MKLIIGLGNPGKKYEQTRHNMGYLVLEELAKRLGIEFREKSSCECWCADTIINGEKVYLCKPQTFMNASGQAVKKIMKKLGIGVEDLLVVYDDADLERGDIRFREGGSSGGHNGLQSILDIFPRGARVSRVRVGIGRPPHTDMKLETFVLGKWSEKEKTELPEIIGRAADMVVEWLS